MAKVKIIPKFKNEDEERKFWDTHDALDYFDTTKPVELDLSELRPSTRPITVRLTESLIASLKQLAHKKRRALPVADENIFGKSSRAGLPKVSFLG